MKDVRDIILADLFSSSHGMLKVLESVEFSEIYQRFDKLDFETWENSVKLANHLPLLLESQSLLSEGDNPEYDRALCELCACMVGFPLGASSFESEEGGAFRVGVMLGCETMEKW